MAATDNTEGDLTPARANSGDVVAAGTDKVLGPELFFGLVGAAGTDLNAAVSLIAQELRRVNYTSSIIRISRLFAECEKYKHLRDKENGPEDERITAAMDAGDDFRRTAKRGDAAVLLGLAEVQKIRNEQGAKEGEPLNRHAFIFHSLKHPEEINTLSEIYQDSFFLVSVYFSKENRTKAISERIMRSRNKYDADEFLDTAKRLIDRDERGLGDDQLDDYGQNVQESFPRGDVFINAQSEKTLRPQIERFVNLLFGHPFTTPTLQEYGMFHAKAAALRSADLSRQVGAVIATDDGEIISAGCNEVPKAGGGSVWEDVGDDKKKDHRDFKVGHDTTAKMKNEIISEVFEQLKKRKWLSEKIMGENIDLLVKEAIDTKNGFLKNARISNIIEFGRTVHAEMSALMDAARRGIPSVRERY